MPELAAPDLVHRLRAWTVLTLAIVLIAVGCASRSSTTTAQPIGSVGAAASAPVAPSPSVPTDGHVAAIEAFVDSVASGDLTYRVGYSGDLRMSSRVVKVKGSMDVVGSDFASAWTYDFHDVPTHHLQVRGVDGKGYIKRQGKAWTRLKAFKEADSYAPFKAVHDATDVRYLGSETVDGRLLHHLSIPDAMLIAPTTIPYNVTNEKIEGTTLDVWIDDQGRPRVGTWELSATARIGEGRGQLQRLVYALDLTFSKVGSKLSVKAP